MASMQRRKGPNVVGTLGLLQPLADGFKLLLKEPLIPQNINLGILYLFAVSSLGVYGILIAGWAKTNRAPFDLPEAEAELVAGYNVEYSSMAFALFFLGEYANMLLMSSLCEFSILLMGFRLFLHKTQVFMK
eukprot:scaffold5782_cov618-Prasinococcus_capsulatus_cf.AAC.5